MERMANREQNSNEKRARLAPALFVVVLLVSFALMNVLPDGEVPPFLSAAMASSLGDSTGLLNGIGFDGGASADLAAVVWQILREGALAAVALVAVAVAVPSALHWSLRGKRAPGLRLGPGFVVAMLVVGLLGGAFSTSAAVNGGALFGVAGCVQTLLQGFGFVVAAAIAVILGGPQVWTIVLLLAVVALLTGLFEEAFMRVLGTETVVGGLRARGMEKRRAVLLAAVVTSAIFALLHVGALAEGSGVAGWLQMAGRFLQTGLFGFCMAGLYEQSKSLWPCALLHAGFNLLYLNIFPFVPDMAPAYGSGALSVSMLLAITTICLVPLAVKAYRVMTAPADE